MATQPVVPTGHIGLNVSDLGRSQEFYGQIFGLGVLHESRDRDRQFAILGSKDRIILTLWQQSEGRAEYRRPGLHHLSFQADSVQQVQTLEARLRDLGVKFHHHGIVPHGEGADSGGIYFEDPDGIRLEIFAPSGVKELHALSTDGPACGFF